MTHTTAFSTAALIAQIDDGWQPDYLFFWGHQPTPGKPIGKWCLSQWFPAPFVLENIEYPTAEHFMMAEKARLFGDHDALKQILTAPHPGAAKALGQQVQGFDEAAWTQQRFAIVVRGNRAKFAQDEQLRTYLRNTNDKVLVEASPTDTVWGIGLAENDRNASNPTAWRGENLLGFALMKVRFLLQEE